MAATLEQVESASFSPSISTVVSIASSDEFVTPVSLEDSPVTVVDVEVPIQTKASTEETIPMKAGTDDADAESDWVHYQLHLLERLRVNMR